MNRIYLTSILLLLTTLAFAQRNKKVVKDLEPTEFKFKYASSLNNDSEGPSADQTIANLAFFKWLHESYDVHLDEYIIDTEVPNLENLFSTNFEDVNNAAKTMGAQLKLEDIDNLSPKGDVGNNISASHNRASSLARNDKDQDSQMSSTNFCFSPPFEYWEDEFVLNVFGKNSDNELTISGNPWLLADEKIVEFARLMKLRKKHHKLLSKKKSLPKSCGPNAYCAGNKSEKILTLSNPSWKKTLVRITLDEELGLTRGETIQIRSYFPVERIIGHYAYGQIVDLEVLPFRSALYHVGPILEEDITIMDLNYKIESDTKKEKVIRFYKNPSGANTGRVELNEDFKEFTLDGKEMQHRRIRALQLKNDRRRNRKPYHVNFDRTYKFKEIKVDDNAEALYESVAFAADNSTLETASISHNDWSEVAEIKTAQEAFFNQESFIKKGAWYKHLFDGDLTTAYGVQEKANDSFNGKEACLRIDLGKVIRIEKIKIIVESEQDLSPNAITEKSFVEASKDLLTWEKIPYEVELDSKIYFDDQHFRYIRIPKAPNRIAEIEVYDDGIKLEEYEWKVTNLFPHASQMEPLKIFRSRFIRPVDIHRNAYFCIALEGKHGVEGAYVAAKVDNEFVGCPLRSTPYPTNNWANNFVKSDKNYTYYFPLTDDLKNKKIEFYIMAYDQDNLDFESKFYLTSSDPYDTSLLVIKK